MFYRCKQVCEQVLFTIPLQYFSLVWLDPFHGITIFSDVIARGVEGKEGKG